jgi:hypothetical protein
MGIAFGVNHITHLNEMWKCRQSAGIFAALSLDQAYFTYKNILF